MQDVDSLPIQIVSYRLQRSTAVCSSSFYKGACRETSSADDEDTEELSGSGGVPEETEGADPRDGERRISDGRRKRCKKDVAPNSYNSLMLRLDNANFSSARPC